LFVCLFVRNGYLRLFATFLFTHTLVINEAEYGEEDSNGEDSGSIFCFCCCSSCCK
jgi:hypothetical protein